MKNVNFWRNEISSKLFVQFKNLSTNHVSKINQNHYFWMRFNKKLTQSIKLTFLVKYFIWKISIKHENFSCSSTHLVDWGGTWWCHLVCHPLNVTAGFFCRTRARFLPPVLSLICLWCRKVTSKYNRWINIAAFVSNIKKIGILRMDKRWERDYTHSIITLRQSSTSGERQGVWRLSLRKYVKNDSWCVSEC